jgi:hypothetical protein
LMAPGLRNTITKRKRKEIGNGYLRRSEKKSPDDDVRAIGTFKITVGAKMIACLARGQGKDGCARGEVMSRKDR